MYGALHRLFEMDICGKRHDLEPVSRLYRGTEEKWVLKVYTGCPGLSQKIHWDHTATAKRQAEADVV